MMPKGGPGGGGVGGGGPAPTPSQASAAAAAAAAAAQARAVAAAQARAAAAAVSNKNRIQAVHDDLRRLAAGAGGAGGASSVSAAPGGVGVRSPGSVPVGVGGSVAGSLAGRPPPTSRDAVVAANRAAAAAAGRPTAGGLANPGSSAASFRPRAPVNPGASGAPPPTAGAPPNGALTPSQRAAAAAAAVAGLPPQLHHSPAGAPSQAQQQPSRIPTSLAPPPPSALRVPATAGAPPSSLPPKKTVPKRPVIGVAPAPPPPTAASSVMGRAPTAASIPSSVATSNLPPSARQRPTPASGISNAPPTNASAASNPAPAPSSSASSGGAASAGGGGGPMRELKVEDALLYLDQVKLEFGDRPRIYNEFLEIMKNFKAQEIDTPGVISRVSTLFRGYNNLILGFNTFLPEGFKIELKDLEEGGELHAYVKPDRKVMGMPQQQPQQQKPQQQPPPGQSLHKPSAAPQHARPPYYSPSQQQQPPQQPQRMQQQPPPTTAPPAPSMRPHIPPQQQLHQSKAAQNAPAGAAASPTVGPSTAHPSSSSTESSVPPHLQQHPGAAPHQPHSKAPTAPPPPPVVAPAPRPGAVPNSYQSSKMQPSRGAGPPPGAGAGAPGASAVPNLQQGPPRQPPTAKQPSPPQNQHQQPPPPGVMQQQQQQSMNMQGPSAHPPHMSQQQHPPRSTAPPAAASTASSAHPPPHQQPQPAAAQPPQGQGSSATQAVEFDHAISYVTTIKKRFANQPRTYQTFLEILHTYQKEQRGITEVLEQVSDLFSEHPDLLREFTFFLPDAVQKQAKKSLEKAAIEAENRQQQRAAAAMGGAPPINSAAGLSPPSAAAATQPGRAPGRAAAAAAKGEPGAPPGSMPLRTHQGPLGQQPQPQQPPTSGALTRVEGQLPVPPRASSTSSDYRGQPPQQTHPQQPLGGRGMAPPHQHHQATVGSVPPQQQSPPPTSTAGQKFIDMTKAHQSQQAAEPAATQPKPPATVAPLRKRPYSPTPHAEAPTAPITQAAAPPVQQPPMPPAAGAVIPTPAPPAIHHPPQPETFVYNAGVERQFFDAAKEALTSYTRDGGQAWKEFLKCLDMYAQEVLSRTEMLGFVEPLLGKRNTELFEEFKRILAAAGAPNAPTHDDAWHSVPLSEIDFSRCRRCSPSYRALPRDYPNPPCSERSEEEAKVLNNVWVSLPVGSEESYTFRHMRKNQYEEVLFRCEDERFEIDMVIDSNATTLHKLEPIMEEIMQLGQKELCTPNLPNSSGVASEEGKKKDKFLSSALRPCPPGAGAGGKIYQYTLDKSFLGVIHRHAIARIYGDAGQEMLDLLFKNPTVAVPLVVKRLRQKDTEWRAARDVLNRRWKELAELNYYKSLDHRSLTWRTTDKRATSTRTLAAEIKDRAAHNGNEGETALAVKRDKAKEEHGSFYETTMGRSLPRKMDLTNLPKPTKTLFTPHLSLIYENNSWAQRDAYRILAFALERGSTSPADKERCHRLWRDFLGPFFSLGLLWMQKPALSFSASRPSSSPTIVSNGDDSNDEDSSGDENEDLGSHRNVITTTEEVMKDPGHASEDDNEGNDGGGSFLLDHQPIPAGTHVSTTYGEGTILRFRHVDRAYVVSFPWGGVGYCRPNMVLCTVLPTEKSSLTDQLRATDNEIMERPDDMFVIGTQSLYLFFRLHQVLIRRLNIAKSLAYKVSDDKTLSTLVEQMSSEGEPDVGRKRYEAYLSLVYALVEGGYSSSSQGSSASAAEGGKYEDRVRCLLGHGAYELATMDKLISHILKNLQNMGNDETLQNMVQLFRRHIDAGGFKPAAFRQEAAYLSEGENMFAFQYCKVRNTDKSIIHFEFLGCIAESEGEGDISEQDDLMKKETDVIMAEVDEAVEGGIHPPSSKRQRR